MSSLSYSIFINISLFTSIAISLAFIAFTLYLKTQSLIPLIPLIPLILLFCCCIGGGYYCFSFNKLGFNLLCLLFIIIFNVIIFISLYRSLNFILSIPLFISFLITYEIYQGKLYFHFNRAFKCEK
jgi:hypothetical protein